MSKKISVKVSRVKLLGQLKEALRKAKAMSDDYDKAKAKYDEKIEAIEKKVLGNLGKGKVTEFRDTTGHYDRANKVIEYRFTVTFPDTFFVKPEAPDYPLEMLNSHQRDELEQIIKMLELCDDDTVSTGVYGDVARYL
jgi:hypothetical protein